MTRLLAFAGLLALGACASPAIPRDPLALLIQTGDLARAIEGRDCLPVQTTFRFNVAGAVLDIPAAQIIATGMVRAC